MTLDQLTGEEGALVRHYDYDDEGVLVVDLGTSVTDASVDVVGDTAMVVVDGVQHDFEIPAAADDAHTFIKNGVLTIELEATE